MLCRKNSQRGAFSDTFFAFVAGIQEEFEEERRDMLDYVKLLMPDTLENNWVTVKPAHSVLLQTKKTVAVVWQNLKFIYI